MAVLVNLRAFAGVLSHRFFVAMACQIVAATLAHTVAAQDVVAPLPPDATKNAFGAVFGSDLSSDSNVYRVPSTFSPTADIISAVYAGIRIDKQYSLQRFKLEVTETATDYEKATQLDFNALTYKGVWLWALGDRLSGTLSADRGESLVPFQDVIVVGTTSRNVQVTQTQAFDLDGRAVGDWHVLLRVSHSTQTSDLPVQIQPDFDAVSREAGIKYAFPSGASISIVRRATDGQYVGEDNSAMLGTGYVQQESELRASTVPGGSLTLIGRLSWIARTQTNAPLRNYSGHAGEVTVAWTPEPQLSLSLTAKRELDPFQDPTGSYITTNSVSIAPTWNVTALTTAHLRFTHEDSSYLGATVGPVLQPQRNDKMTVAEVGVDWSPERSLTFSAGVQRQLRGSTIALYQYSDTIAKISALLKF